MKVAMYVPAWPPGNSANGIVTYASYMVPALRDLGHDVFLLTSSTNENRDAHLYDLSSYQRPLPLWNRALFKFSSTDAFYSAASIPLVNAVKELVAKHDIDILEIEDSFGLSHAISSLNLIPVVVRLHGPWFLNKRSEDTRREKLERRAISTADAVTSPSRHILSLVEYHYRLKLRRTLTFGNPIVAPSRQWRVSNCDKNRLLFVGRFDQVKGGDLMIDAFSRLAEKDRQLKLTFVGPDHGVDGTKLLEYAKARLSSDALSRLSYTGKLSSNEVAELRLQHFITICASRSEVFPYAVLEAMAFGCPLVASNVGGIPEIVRSGENGILFESQKVDQLVSSVQSILYSPDLAEKLGSAARISVNDYKPEIMAASLAQLYEQTVRAFRLGRRAQS